MTFHWPDVSSDEIHRAATEVECDAFAVHYTPAGGAASRPTTEIGPGSETNIIDDDLRLRSVSYRENPKRPESASCGIVQCGLRATNY